MKVVWSLAATTIGEAIRRRVLLIILFIGLFLTMIAPALTVLSARQEMTVLKSFMLGMVQITGAVIAIVLTVYMIPNEVERRTIYTILSKPVQRWQFLVGKFLGAIFALGLMMALMSLVVVILFMYRQGGLTSEAFSLLKGISMFYVQMCLLASVGVFFSTFVSPIVNFFLSGGLYLVGSVFNPFMQTMTENKELPSALLMVFKVLNFLIPNFANYNVQNPIINPGQTIQNESFYFASVTGYGVLYIGVLLVGAILIFDRREV